MANGYDKISTFKRFLSKPMTIDELAVALDCMPRTIYRRIKVLESENCGLRRYRKEGQTYYVIETAEKTEFNQDIVKKLEKVRKSFGENAPVDIKNRKVLDELIKSLTLTNPDDFTPEAVTLDPNYIMDYGPFSDNKTSEPNVNKILSAIREGRRIKIDYGHTTKQENDENLLVTPVKLILRIDTLYLVAADESYAKTGVFKNYVFDRIKKVVVTDVPSEKAPFDANIHYRYAFGKYTTMDPIEDVVLLVKSPWLQNQFRKSHFSPAAEIHESGDKFTVKLKLRITPDFKSWLMGVISDIQIQKPESLKAEIKENLKKALAEL